MIRKAVFYLCAALVAFGLTVPAFAAEKAKTEKDDKKVDRLKELVVTATRKTEDVFDVPYAATSLSMEMLQMERMVRNMPEALQEEPGVMVQKTGHGMGSPYIRGMTGYHNLLLIDGVRVNNTAFRSGPNQYWALVDVFTIDRLELVRGPGSVLYGSDALGGVVNAITRSVPFAGKDPLTGRVVYRTASAEQSHAGRAEGMNSSKKYSLISGVTFKTFGDLICGKHVGLQPDTNYDVAYGDFKFECEIAKNQKLTLAMNLANQDDSKRTHKMKSIISWRGTDVGSDELREYDQDRMMTYARFHSKKMKGALDEMKLTLSWQILDEQMRRRTDGSSEMRYTEFDITTVGLQGEFKKKCSLGELVFGFEYYRDTADTASYRRDIATGAVTRNDARGTFADDSTYDLAGIFIQDEAKLSKKLDMILGLRYNYAAVDAGVVDPDPADAYPFDSFTNTYSDTVGSLRLKYKAAETANVVFGLSQGFRAPNLNDTTSFEDVRTDSVDVPTPDLEAEKCLSAELGVKFKKKKKYKGEIILFHNMLSDFIRRVPTTYQGQEYADPPTNSIRYYGKENFGEGYVQGVEASWRQYLDESWSLFGSYMYTKGEGDDLVGGVKTTTPLSRIAPQRLKAGFRWDDEKTGSFFEAWSIIADKQDELSPGDESDTSRIPPGGTPGYTTYNVRGGFRICRHAKAAFAVENIFDRDYRVHGSGVNAPGTNFIFTLEMKF